MEISEAFDGIGESPIVEVWVFGEDAGLDDLVLLESEADSLQHGELHLDLITR